MKIPVELGGRSYDITLEHGALGRAGEYLNLDRRVLVVTDSGVPRRYAETVAAACKKPFILTVEPGEGSKSIETYSRLITEMLEHRFTRSDCVVAVGGGVVGDLSGFAAATYMRGIDFYNIPTTLLAQIDSSVGGKTAVNFGGIKNIVGVFYQPKAVLIDPEVLGTLSDRLIACGMAEAIKMALTSDRELFDLIERSGSENADEIIGRSLRIKARVVELDERESGLRRILNFGHTIGHGIESAEAGRLFHGECVALGMLPMCSDSVRERLIPVLCKCGLPHTYSVDTERVYAAMRHDKKAEGDGITVVTVPEPGSYEIHRANESELLSLLSRFAEKPV